MFKSNPIDIVFPQLSLPEKKSSHNASQPYDACTHGPACDTGSFSSICSNGRGHRAMCNLEGHIKHLNPDVKYSTSMIVWPDQQTAVRIQNKKALGMYAVVFHYPCTYT